MTAAGDFSRGRVSTSILYMGLPACAAQIINLLYNLVDRVFIGHIPVTGTPALTGLGVCLPLISLIGAFSNLFGQGAAPLCSIARGRGDHEEAAAVTGNSFTLLVLSGLLVPTVCLLFLDPLLRFFGASADTLPYARDYMTIYLFGSVFVMIATGMNFHISAQGAPGFAMLSVSVGAVLNIALDPVFIFALNMGVRGAAVATVISQAVSAGLALRFFTSKRALYPLRRDTLRPRWELVRRISGLGTASFCFGATNSLVQMVTNRALLLWGGDLYVGAMTVMMSLRDIFMMFTRGVTQGSQPVLGYNYGAKLYSRVRQGILFTLVLILSFNTLVWLLCLLAPGALMRIYTNDEALIALGRPLLRLYMSAFFMMGLQFVGQNTFTALGKSKQAVFFSLFRKVIIVVPVTLLLPRLIGVSGVFWAEPISDYIGATACFTTMMLTVYRPLGRAAVGTLSDHSDKETLS